MKRLIFIILFLPELLAVNPYSPANALSPGKDTLNFLLKKAEVQHKKLFLEFGWEGCGWCRRLKKYQDDPAIKGILGKDFLFAYLDIYKSPAGKELYAVYGKQGTPSWTIFDASGKVLADCDNGKGNIGYPGTPEELDYYISVIRKSAPGISTQDCEILVSKLKEYRDKK